MNKQVPRCIGILSGQAQMRATYRRRFVEPSRRIDHTQVLTLFSVAAIVVVFVVFLIYFVALPVHRRAGPSRPFSSTAVPITESETDLTIYVLADGRLLLGREIVNEIELTTRLRERNKLTPGRQLVLEADRGAAYAKVEAVFRAARDAGFRDVRVLTGAKDPLDTLQYGNTWP